MFDITSNISQNVRFYSEFKRSKEVLLEMKMKTEALALLIDFVFVVSFLKAEINHCKKPRKIPINHGLCHGSNFGLTTTM